MDPRKTLAFSIITIAIAIISIGLFWENNLLVSAILIAVIAVSFYVYRTKKDLVYFFVAVIFGTTAEIFCITFGVWSYANPTFIIPLWLPLIWGIAGINLPRLANAIMELGGMKK